MLISLIMQIAQSMQISIRHFLNPQTMHITFPLKNLAVKNISGLTHCRYSSGKWTISEQHCKHSRVKQLNILYKQEHFHNTQNALFNYFSNAHNTFIGIVMSMYINQCVHLYQCCASIIKKDYSVLNNNLNNI